MIYSCRVSPQNEIRHNNLKIKNLILVYLQWVWGMYQNFPNGYILLLPKQEYRSYSVDSSQKLTIQN